VGSYAHLSLGRLTIDESKWGWIPDFSALFQSADVVSSERTFDDDEPTIWWEMKRPFALVVARLELLGFTMANVHRDIESRLAPLREPYDEEPTSRSDSIKSLKPEDVAGVISAIIASSERPLSERVEGLQYYLPMLLSEELTTKLAIDNDEAESLVGGLSEFAILRLLAENAENHELELIWDVGEIVANEYAPIEYFAHPLKPERRFLLVTEGKSDIAILQRAFGLRRSDVADFFYYINVTEGYPFVGTGNLYNFCSGLSAIGALNRILILYDNDAAGIERYRKTSERLTLPPNIAVIHLPDLEAGKTLTCLGPDGPAKADINGRAASIECYLDLTRIDREPQIRWSNYVEAIGSYQGALLGKDDYVQEFLRADIDVMNYDFGNVDLCLNAIIQRSIEMAQEILEDFRPALVSGE
jgi:hypothetical protein